MLERRWLLVAIFISNPHDVAYLSGVSHGVFDTPNACAAAQEEYERKYERDPPPSPMQIGDREIRGEWRFRCVIF
jgi:hypothetical protein